MSTYVVSRRRTLLRAAVATAALAGALLSPAAAFAADAPQSAGAAKPAAPARAAASGGEVVGHPVLADGTKGELWQKGKGWYFLDLHTDAGMPIGSLQVGGPSGRTEDGQQIRGMWVTLTSFGAVHSWSDRATGHGFDAGGTEVIKNCTVTWGTGTPFDGVSLRLSNGPAGPVAELFDATNGKTLDILTTVNRTGLSGGARIKDADDPKTPQFQMRVIGGQIPWEGINFPKPPTNCGDKAAPAPATAAKPAAPITAAQPASFANHASQTAVVPKGPVAAGAETANNTGDHTPLIAGGAGAAALGAAGFAALRRRATRRD
ncbi:hypothetical protein DT019_34280 [Streptomyces sp. SDr-06]|uniref:hypothetical protein n=1 Tax=Streptomyces sp. SDr-06 TaxID=2267702 RepID=UPI000DE81E6C|nr:hypothetical protein [Streptomyces sp. SDr-06]RCH64256.1 hypothetical protein DT019_34280 [Streptomyces sp. SDr-06]